jgi:sugar phosphate isomerase/epimerase
VAPLTAFGASVFDFVDSAARAGFDHVGLRLKTPTPGTAREPVMGDGADRRKLVRHVRDAALSVLQVEAIWISPDFDLGAVKATVDLAAELGAKYLLAVGDDEDPSRLAGNLERVVRLAEQAGMRVALEFMPYASVATLPNALGIVNAFQRDSLGLVVDALHLARSKATPADLGGLPAGKLFFLHLCDGSADGPIGRSALREEARTGRLLPGHGHLPLADLIAMAPAGTPVELECPVWELRNLPTETRLRKTREAILPLVS